MVRRIGCSDISKLMQFIDIASSRTCGIMIACKDNGRILPLSPRRITWKEEVKLAMRTFREIIFACAMVAGLTFAVSAQKDDQKKPPPKNPPPVINPQQKPPPDGNKPRKPGFAMAVIKALDPEERS